MTPEMPNPATEFVRRYWPEDGDMPKHRRLRNAFAASIEDGYWQPGARLPTETDLVAATPCSLGTVQRALRDLTAEGIISRRRGSGSTVADRTGAIEQPWHMRFRDPADRDGGYLPVHTRGIFRETGLEKGPWSEPLGQQDSEVIRIDRVFRIGDRMRVYASFHALASLYPDLCTMPISDLSGANLKQMTGGRNRIPVHRVRQTLRFETPPDHVSLNSDCAAGVPATVLNVVAFSLTGDAVYYQDFYIPETELELDLGLAGFGS